MWARKAKTTCRDEDSGVVSEVDYVHLEESWYEILGEGFAGVIYGFVLFWAALIGTPIMAIRAAYRQAKYANCPVPQNEVRERAHLG